MGIALDENRGQLYLTCDYSDTVVRANLDSSNPTNLGSLNDTLVGPQGIALDLDAPPYLPVVVR